MSLRIHQHSGVKFLIDYNGGLVGDDMGSGKTRLSLAYAKWCIYLGLIDRVLVVCPSAIVTNWMAEVEKYYGFKPTTNYKSKRLEDNWIAITTYPLLRYKNKFGYPNYEAIVKHFAGHRLLVILDEAHEISNSDSQTFMVCCNLPAEIKVAMTGTPVSNRPEDLFGILHFIDRTITKQWFFDNFIITTYKEITTKTRRKVWVKQVTGYKNQDKLNALLKTRMIRRLTSECIDLPPLNRIFMPYEIDNNKIYQSTLNLCDVNDEPMMVKVTRLQEAASGLNPWDETKQGFEETEKLRLLESLLESGSGRIVVWFKFYETLAQVSKYLRGKGYDIYEWHGGNSNTRDKQKSAWAVSDRGVILCTIKAAGVGLNFVEGQISIMFESELSPAAMSQAEKRIHRDGQQNSCTIFYLYGRQSVEEAVIHLLKKKIHLNSVVTDSFTQEDLQAIYRYSFRLEY
jgi:SNF2 family DNA or RNA helicase